MSWTAVTRDGQRLLLEQSEDFTELDPLIIDGLTPSEAFSWRMTIELTGLAKTLFKPLYNRFFASL